MKKDTSEMLKELEDCFDFGRFYAENEEAFSDITLSELLQFLLNKHGIKKSDAIKRSELSEIYAYQIFSGVRVPERKKLLALCVGMMLSFDEIQQLLRVCGYAPLYVKNEYDCILTYGIYKSLSVMEINEMLFDYGFDTLG